ncbi:hypothetical protein GF342_04250 [Candidatus Woesearchaeota archaeon]|nr:hypothetical protein [Candidatus Woesearchaeota archaeon]
MKRKVIQLAEKTFVVSLPSTWVKKYGVQKSDELRVEEKHNALVISTDGAIEVPESISVDISGLTEGFVKSIVSVLHKVGYDEIEFLYDDPVLAALVCKRTEELIGFEVVEQTPKRVVIKNVSGDLTHELDSMVRRTFLVTLSLAESVASMIAKGQLSELQSLLPLEKTSNRLTNYCHRLLNKQSRGSQTVFLYTILSVLESIGDEFRDICLSLHTAESLPRAELVGLLQKVGQHLRKYYAHFYDAGVDNMEALRKENAGLASELKEMETRSAADRVLLAHLFVVVQRIYDCFGSTTGRKFLQAHA